jgi:hypothetical protein
MANYSGSGRFSAVMALLGDGDVADAAHFNPALQQLLDIAAGVVFEQANFTSERVKTTTADLNGIAYGRQGGADLWVAVGDAESGSGALLVVSTAGQRWTEVSNPKDADLYGVAYDPALDLWAAVGAPASGDAYIITATNPLGAWTERSNPTGVTLWSVASNGAGVFVAVGEATGGQSYILRSVDGITWAQQAAPINHRLACVIFAAGLFVAVGGTAPNGRILTSPDGIAWTEVSNPSTDAIDSVCHNGSVFLTVASAAGEVLYSSSGSAWGTRAGAGVPAGSGGYGIAADPVTGLTIVWSTSSYEFFASINDGVSFKNMGPAARLDADGPLETFGLANGAGRWMGAARYGHTLRGVRR